MESLSEHLWTRQESDIDLCIDIDAETDYEGSKFRLKVLSELPDFFDVQIFSQLPLYVKKEVLKGKVIYCRDEEYLYETAISTIKEFEDFKYRYYDYIGERAIVWGLEFGIFRAGVSALFFL